MTDAGRKKVVILKPRWENDGNNNMHIVYKETEEKGILIGYENMFYDNGTSSMTGIIELENGSVKQLGLSLFKVLK